jgi:DNA-binding XRE family transcriptional regulator
MKADPKSLMFWERDEREPFVSFFPSIIDFLGYEPWPEPTNLGDALLAARRKRGLEIRAAAKRAGVDEGTWRRWERGEWRPTKAKVAAIDALLGYGVAERFPTDVR